MPGVTRDRIYADCEWCGHNFTLVDTGGLDFSNSNDDIQTNILTQAQVAIDLADVIMLFVDGREGITHSDRDVADFLRKSKKPIVLVVNKLDNNEVEKSYDFYELGLGEPFPVSAEQAKGVGDVLDEVVKHFKVKVTDEDLVPSIKIAIVGRPNAGKSSKRFGGVIEAYFNRICRSIVRLYRVVSATNLCNTIVHFVVKPRNMCIRTVHNVRVAQDILLELL